MLHEKLKAQYLRLKLDENKGNRRFSIVQNIVFVMEAQKKYNNWLVVMKQFDATLSVYSNEVETYVYAWCMVLY